VFPGLGCGSGKTQLIRYIARPGRPLGIGEAFGDPAASRALLLAALYGRTAAEVSEAESIPLGTAKTRIRGGLMKLRDAMAIADAGT